MTPIYHERYGVPVSTPDTLMQDLQAAAPGSTIQLAPGTYPKLELIIGRHPWANWAEPVKLVSADASQPAVLTGFELNGIAGLTLDGLLCDYDAAPGERVYASPFTVSDCDRISILNSIFDGDLAEGVDEIVDGHGTGKGLMVGGSSNVTVEGNEFFRWFVAAAFGGNTNLKVVGNEIYAIRSDGFDFVKNQGVVIEKNHFHDFERAEGSGDHSDMIQFWTTELDHYTADVVIRDNRFMSGEGDLTQSIFMRNGMVDTGQAGLELYYRNILIEDNLIWNAHTHGIHVGEAIGVVVRNNTVLHNAKEQDGGSVGHAPRITIAGKSQEVAVTGNIAGTIPEARDGWTVEHNLISQRDWVGQPNYYGDLFINAMNDGRATIADLQALPGGVIETEGYGAAVTRYDPTPDTLTPVIRPIRDGRTVSLDASFSAGPAGRIGTGAAVSWDLGDGTSAEGVEVTHRYAPGTYAVRATVIDADGSVATADTEVRVPDPLLLDIRVKDGAVSDLSTYQQPIAATVGIVDGRDGGQAFSIGTAEGFGVDKTTTMRLFDLDRMTVEVGFRAEGKGEIVRIHNSILIHIDDAGRLLVDMDNAAGEKISIGSDDPVTDGAWHDLQLLYGNGEAVLMVDGVEVDAQPCHGRTDPYISWGLTIGGGGWREGFTGAIDRVVFRSDLPGDDAEPPTRGVADVLADIEADLAELRAMLGV